MTEDSLEKDRFEAAPMEGEMAGVREKAEEGEAERMGESVGEGVDVFLTGTTGSMGLGSAIVIEAQQ